MLSICIPTHNRYPFLQWTLAKTQKDFPDAQIIVSDNASTDATQYWWSDSIKVIRQKENIGAFQNLRAALLAATGKYAVYLGDDDYLLADRINEGIQYLERNPGTVCFYAPCQLYDEVAQTVAWNAFYVANDETFTDPGKLWNFLINNHVWPEHAIWRREGLEAILQPRIRAYWAFVDLANAFARGAVHFAKEPYYRNITNHPVGMRQKLGDQQCLTDFDEYRWGLELLAAQLFRGRLTPELKRGINMMIQHFINLRIGVAHKILASQNRMAEALPYEQRLQICG